MTHNPVWFRNTDAKSKRTKTLEAFETCRGDLNSRGAMATGKLKVSHFMCDQTRNY